MAYSNRNSSGITVNLNGSILDAKYVLLIVYHGMRLISNINSILKFLFLIFE